MKALPVTPDLHRPVESMNWFPVDTVRSVESSSFPEEHLIILHNPAATNGDSRTEEIDELTSMEHWRSLTHVPTHQDTAVTAGNLARSLKGLERTSPGGAVTIVSIGGDGTQHAALMGYLQANVKDMHVKIAPAGAGNKNDLSTTFGTKEQRLRDIITYGREVQAYPLELAVGIEGEASQTHVAFYNASADNLGTKIAEEMNNPDVRAELKHASSIRKRKTEGQVVWRALRKARHEPIIVEDSSMWRRKNKELTHLMFAGSQRAAGGALNFETSIYRPKEFVVSHSGKRWARILGEAAMRFIGWAYHDHSKIHRRASFKLRGVSKLQLDGEVVPIQEESQAYHKSVTLSVGRLATPVTVLKMDRNARTAAQQKTNRGQMTLAA